MMKENSLKVVTIINSEDNMRLVLSDGNSALVSLPTFINHIKNIIYPSNGKYKYVNEYAGTQNVHSSGDKFVFLLANMNEHTNVALNIVTMIQGGGNMHSCNANIYLAISYNKVIITKSIKVSGKIYFGTCTYLDIPYYCAYTEGQKNDYSIDDVFYSGYVPPEFKIVKFNLVSDVASELFIDTK